MPASFRIMGVASPEPAQIAERVGRIKAHRLAVVPHQVCGPRLDLATSKQHAGERAALGDRRPMSLPHRACWLAIAVGGRPVTAACTGRSTEDSDDNHS